MAVDAAGLTERYPEFVTAVNDYPDMVDGCIAQAKTTVTSDVYGTKYTYAALALAAHYVAINPLGEMARIDFKKGRAWTPYLEQFEFLRKTVAGGAGFRVI